MAVNSLGVPHIFNHFDCHLTNAAKTCCNFSHSMTGESCGLIWGLLPFFASFFHLPPFFCFHMTFHFPPLSLSLLTHVSACCHPLTNSCSISGLLSGHVWHGLLKSLPTHCTTSPKCMQSPGPFEPFPILLDLWSYLFLLLKLSLWMNGWLCFWRFTPWTKGQEKYRNVGMSQIYPVCHQQLSHLVL